jgi:exosome complex exonuclease RRP6
LDELSGKRKNLANIPTTNHGETKSSFFALMRPQLTFPDKVDNSDTSFVSKLKFKHHALNNSGPLLSTHPYFNEITYINHPSHMFNVRPEMMYASMEETPFIWVDTVDALQEMVLKLSNVSEIAVDLEHHDYRSYLGFTCLIQISTRTEDFVIDALKLRGQLHLLNDPFANPNIVKVLHGAQYDIIWLQRDFGIYIVNLFDTYHASHILEMGGHSLAFLLQSYCNVSTDKKYQLADWRVR